METERDLSGHERHLLPVEPSRNIFRNKHGSVITHGANKEERRLIFGALKALTPEIQKSIDSISILSSGNLTRDHLKYLDNDPKNPIVAHCHKTERGCICVERPYLDEGYIWHEAAHAHTFALDAEFLVKWRKIAGDVYGKNRYPATQKFPDLGVMTGYGSRDELEDIAEWVECIYTAFYDGDARFEKIDKTKKDKRYVKKLLTLYIYGFFDIKLLRYIMPLIP